MQKDDYELGLDTNVLKALNVVVDKRLKFIQRVYGILSLQLLLNCVTIAIVYLNQTVQTFALSNIWLFYTSSIGSLGILIALMIWKKSYPANLILLFSFTLVEGYMLAVVCTQYYMETVLQAFVITLSVFFALSSYAMTSKRDFSFLGAGLFTCLWILLIGGILQLWFPLSSVAEVLWCFFGAGVFCGYILFDTWLLTKKLNTDEEILAAVSLYLDLVNLFLYILRILSKFQKK